MSTVAAHARSDTDPPIGVLVGVVSGSLGFLLLIAIVNALRLSPFGLENPNEIFVATTEPHGLIRGTIARR